MQVDGARVSALWHPSEVLSLKLSALYQHNKSDSLSEANTLGTLKQNTINGAEEFDNTLQAYSAVLKVRFGAAELTSVTGYNDFNSVAHFDYTPFLGSYTQCGDPGVGSNGQCLTPGTGFNGFGVTGTILNDFSDTRVLTQELRLALPIGDKLDSLIGLFYDRERGPYYDTVSATVPTTGQIVAPTALYLPFPANFDEYSAFTNLTYHVTNRFDIQVGGRESHMKVSAPQVAVTGPFTFAFYGVPPPAIQPAGEAVANTFTYLVTPSFKLTPDLMLYARAASGYRPGGFNTAAVGIPPQFNPDKTKNYEIGVKGNALDHALSFEASVYYIDWKNIQIQLFNPVNLGYESNGSAAKSEGVELSVEAKPFRDLTVAAWFTYDKAVLTQDFPANSTSYGAAGDRLPNSSRFSGNVSLEQKFRLTNDVTGFVGGAESYVGDRLGVFLATSGGLPQPRQEFPAYAKTDLHAGVSADAWTVNIYANNVTNKRALINGGAGYVAASAYVYITPRTVGVSVSKSF
jgi:outer membrane receptor protein involved in Fe transport